MTKNMQFFISFMLVILVLVLLLPENEYGEKYLKDKLKRETKKEIVEIATKYGIVKLDNPGDDYEYVGNESGGVFLPKDKSKITYGPAPIIDKEQANWGVGGPGIEYKRDNQPFIAEPGGWSN